MPIARPLIMGVWLTYSSGSSATSSVAAASANSWCTRGYWRWSTRIAPARYDNRNPRSFHMPNRPRTTSSNPRSSRSAVSAPRSAGCSHARELIPVSVVRDLAGRLSSSIVIVSLPSVSSGFPGYEPDGRARPGTSAPGRNPGRRLQLSADAPASRVAPWAPLRLAPLRPVIGGLARRAERDAPIFAPVKHRLRAAAAALILLTALTGCHHDRPPAAVPSFAAPVPET